MTSKVDPAENISRHWYVGLPVVEEGVNYGECMVYDSLQIVNRLVIEHNRSLVPPGDIPSTVEPTPI